MLRIVLALGLALAPPDDPRVFEIVPTPLAPSESVPEARVPESPVPAAVPPPPLLVEVDPINYRIVLVGDVLVGLGGVGFVVMCAGLLVRSDAAVLRDAEASAMAPDSGEIARQDRRIALGTNLALAGGVSAAVLFVSGIGMIIGGRQRERRRRAALDVSSTPGGLLLRF